jgi:dihydroorotate dehydrogenase (NAD+) catalytic subunit
MLSVAVGPLSFRNPTLLASGIMGSYASSLRRVAEKGAGGVVTKSIGVEARAGHPNPTVVEVEGGLLNAVGLSNPGIEAFRDEMEALKDLTVPLIGSVYGFSSEEYAGLAQTMEDYGADAVELNLSCPNVDGVHFAQDPDLAETVVREVKGAVRIPVIPKLTAEVRDIVEVAKACEEGGADAVTAINTLRGMRIETRTRHPILGNRIGGLSGPAIHPIAVRCVYEIARETSLSILGCGGASTGEEVLEFLMAGASAVEIGTGVHRRGLTVFKRVTRELERWMEENGVAALDEIIGAAH